MNEADKEFYGEFLKVREKMLSDGWQEARIRRDHAFIEGTFVRGGYAFHFLFGCEESVKEEVL